MKNHEFHSLGIAVMTFEDIYELSASHLSYWPGKNRLAFRTEVIHGQDLLYIINQDTKSESDKMHEFVVDTVNKIISIPFDQIPLKIKDEDTLLTKLLKIRLEVGV